MLVSRGYWTADVTCQKQEYTLERQIGILCGLCNLPVKDDWYFGSHCKQLFRKSMFGQFTIR